VGLADTKKQKQGRCAREERVSIYSVIGLTLMIWALPTLVFAFYRKDRDQIIRASRVTCIAALIIAIGYVCRDSCQ